MGLEPTTCGLRNRCSATELHRRQRITVTHRYWFDTCARRDYGRRVTIATRALLVVPAALLAYGIFALTRGRWLHGLAAPLVAWLLFRRHRRARFAAYVFLTAVFARSVLTQDWLVASGAVGLGALLQLPAATREWPRIRPGFRRTPAGARDGSARWL